jgi:hypothetical protein
MGVVDLAALVPETRWCCPSCGGQDVTREALPHTRMHSCPSLYGLTAPMVPEGTRAEHRVNEREDWVGDEDVQTDGRGRPVMNVITMRDDGYDCTVYAPCAKPDAESIELARSQR